MIAATISFRITFSYQRHSFTATVHRYELDPVKYVAIIDKNGDLNIELPSVIALVLQNGSVTFSHAGRDIQLKDSIASAIKDYCTLNNIPLV